jgi:1-deoxy-D-xylulose-5-phosphate synthase
VGATLSQALRDADVDVPARDLGIPQRFLEQGSRAEVLADIGLTAQEVARKVVEAVARLEDGLEDTHAQSADHTDAVRDGRDEA